MRILRQATAKGDYWIEEVTETPAETAHVTFCPIRFQGQWEDAETALYQNRFRYYDPGAGQFASRDPIGLLGGTSVTGYVDTPSVFIDAMGLEPHHATWILRDTLGNVIGEGALSSVVLTPKTGPN